MPLYNISNIKKKLWKYPFYFFYFFLKQMCNLIEMKGTIIKKKNSNAHI